MEVSGIRKCYSASGVRFGKLVVQGQRLRRYVENPFEWNVHLIDHVEKRIAVSDSGVSARVIRVELDRFCKHPPRELEITFGIPVKKIATAQVVSVGLHVQSRRFADQFLFLRQQLHFQLLDDSVRDFVLDGEDVGEIAIVSLGPNMAAALAAS